jgi:hypothetical protein
MSVLLRLTVLPGFDSGWRAEQMNERQVCHPD